MAMNPQVGAASTHVHDLLTGAPRPGVVRLVGRDRAAVEVAGRLVVLVRATGPRTLPCSVVVPALEPERLGREGDVGDGRIRFGGLSVDVVRWWQPARVRPGVHREPPWSTTPAPVVDDATRLALQRAATAMVRDDGEAAREHLVSVLGRGGGSTPDADDAVAGVLLAARSVAAPGAAAEVESVAAAVAQAARSRTTLLSTELLRAAADGLAAPVLVHHLESPSPTSEAAVQALGATSGRATLEGVSALHHAWRTARGAVAA